MLHNTARGGGAPWPGKQPPRLSMACSMAARGGLGLLPLPVRTLWSCQPQMRACVLPRAWPRPAFASSWQPAARQGLGQWRTANRPLPRHLRYEACFAVCPQPFLPQPGHHNGGHAAPAGQQFGADADGGQRVCQATVDQVYPGWCVPSLGGFAGGARGSVLSGRPVGTGREVPRQQTAAWCACCACCACAIPGRMPPARTPPPCTHGGMLAWGRPHSLRGC